jgi:hypothetical protein
MPIRNTIQPKPQPVRHTIRYTEEELIALMMKEHPEAQGHDAFVWGLERQYPDDRALTFGRDEREQDHDD